MADAIKVENGKVLVALTAFALSIRQRHQLLTTLALGQLESIYKTFAEQGSPAGSWVPLAASTLKRKGYGAGHKILVNRGLLRNSIRISSESSDSVQIGTNLVYAAVHQFGSRDRGGAIGPQARIEGHSVKVSAHEYDFAHHSTPGDVRGMGQKGRMRLLVSGVKFGHAKVGEHQRFQNIPARPYLVFRPEDPQRMTIEVQGYLVNRAKAAGLEATGL